MIIFNETDLASLKSYRSEVAELGAAAALLLNYVCESRFLPSCYVLYAIIFDLPSYGVIALKESIIYFF